MKGYDRTSVKMKVFRFRDSDLVNLEEIMATGCFDDETEAVRYTLQIAVSVAKYLIELDPNATFFEAKNQQGIVTAIEDWGATQYKEAIQLLAQDMGVRNLLARLDKAKKRRAGWAKDRSYVEKAKEMLRKHRPGPYGYEEIIDAVKKASWDGRGNTIGLDYAKQIVGKELQAKRITHVGPAQYDFVEQIPVQAPLGGSTE